MRIQGPSIGGQSSDLRTEGKTNKTITTKYVKEHEAKKLPEGHEFFI